MNSKMTGTWQIAAAFVLVLLLSAGAVADSDTVSYQGVLRNDTLEPVDDGAYAMEFSLWDAETDGNQIWGPESHTNVTTTNGMFSIYLGSDVSLGTVFADNSALWLEIAADTGSGLETYTPRIPLASVPYAQYAPQADSAAQADQADNATSADNADNATSADNAGDADNLGGNPPTAYAPTGHNHAASQITSGVLNINRLPVGTGSDQVAQGDHRHTNLPYFIGQVGNQTDGVKTLNQQEASGITLSGGTQLVAPVAGRYYVHFQQLFRNNGGGSYLRLQRNGVTQAEAYLANDAFRDMIVARIVNMDAGDTIRFRIDNAVAETWDGGHSTVSMYLMD
ncbi:MAG: hypothetical protein ACLFTT_10430 [Candidatus Hydrogenedentota bacterium]